MPDIVADIAFSDAIKLLDAAGSTFPSNGIRLASSVYTGTRTRISAANVWVLPVLLTSTSSGAKA